MTGDLVELSDIPGARKLTSGEFISAIREKLEALL